MRFDELRTAARELARGLVGAGVVKGARVALLMANGPDWVVASFAVSLVGGVAVPVNTFATPAERDYILAHSDASLLVMQTSMGSRNFVAELAERHGGLPGSPPGRLRWQALPHLRRIVCLGEGAGSAAERFGIESGADLLAQGRDVSEALLDAASAQVHPADDGLLIYTSGTTAHPKGVLHRQRAPVIQSWRFAEGMALTAEDIVLTAQPFFWTAGVAMSLGASLAAGARLIVEPVFDAARFLEIVEDQRVSVLHAWPHQEKAMAEHPDAETRDLSSLAKIEFGSPLAPLAGIEADEWGTYGSYGLSETFTLASSLPAAAPAPLRSATSGRALPGMQLRIVDPETGDILTRPEEKGEIAVRGLTFMRDYAKVEPELYLDDEGFFRTQDAGSVDADGYLHWTGRLSNLIKTGGANVSPLEIDAVLATCPGVGVGAAVGVPHPVLGEIIVVCAVRVPGAQIEESELRTLLRGQLAAYKVPKRVLFFEADELNFTGTEKLQTAPLRELALARLRAEGAEIDGVRYQT
jgi:fatty-acyl-CoA synthase